MNPDELRVDCENDILLKSEKKIKKINELKCSISNNSNFIDTSLCISF